MPQVFIWNHSQSLLPTTRLSWRVDSSTRERWPKHNAKFRFDPPAYKPATVCISGKVPESTESQNSNKLQFQVSITQSVEICQSGSGICLSLGANQLLRAASRAGLFADLHRSFLPILSVPTRVPPWRNHLFAATGRAEKPAAVNLSGSMKSHVIARECRRP